MIKKNKGHILRTKIDIRKPSAFFHELKRLKMEENKKGILFVIHSLGGGTEHYQNLLIDEMKDTKRIYVLQIAGPLVLLKDIQSDSKISGPMELFHPPAFRMWLDLLKIDLIYVNNLVTYPIPAILDSIQHSGVEYHFFIHDYFCVCPKIQMLNQENMYCGAEIHTPICQTCIHASGLAISIQTWRTRFEHFLMNAAQVLAPSKTTADIVQKYYPQVKITIQEHHLPPYVTHTFRPEFADKKELTIAFIGNLNPVKGSEICLQLHQKITGSQLPVRIIVIGSLNGNKGQGTQSPTLLVTGPFANQEISCLLEKNQVAFVIMSSIWPETYSYTASEAMLSGYPLVTFDLGAPAERVRRMNGGWIVDEVQVDPLFRLISRLWENREEIKEKANYIQRYIQTHSPKM